MNETHDLASAEEARYFAERRQRVRVVMTAVPALAGLLLVLWTIGVGDDFFFRKSLLPKETFLSIAVLLIGFSGLSVVMTYLQTGFKRSVEVELEAAKYQRETEATRSNDRAELAKLAAELKVEAQRARDEIASAKAVATSMNDGDRSLLLDELMARINSEAGARVLAELKSQVAETYSRDSRAKELLLQFDESRARLATELEALGRRGNLNLALGAVTTIIGLALLGASVFSEITAASKDLWAFVSHFIPRLTLVVMIELFAYFFLSLYKASLAEIKYFQNELTNVEAKQVSLRAAISYGDQAMIGDTLAKLAATERNHILSKDQTTVELEKAKIERDTKGEIAKYVSELFQKKA
ncbi:hypothetical protein ACTJKQ_16960 [Acidovorax sp. 22279]|uniref:hypothetical protein n=1 Tax=Acidovorax sp. 22279 TaxID=3453900 RepID=UPI003F8467FE